MRYYRTHLALAAADMLCNNILNHRVRQEFVRALHSYGISEAETAHLADAAMIEFDAVTDALPDLPVPKIVSDLMMVGVRATRQASLNFHDAAQLTLPTEAPELWANRDKRKREMPIDFLRRVWGRFIDAGILYQIDLKELGETRLIPAIRVYCHNHGIQASTVLPLPIRVKLDRALVTLPEGPVKAAVRNKIAGRARSARHRRQHLVTFGLRD